ncbi:MAG: RNA chaperone Hfq [Firmicutes bacterium]|jgi:host factor-I protein|nr:RNA chaperone Hfq [Bacillota bacterium]
MNKPVNLQDVFLNTLRKEKTDVTVFLMNGFQIKGVIRGYDSFVILIESDGRQQVIYKHAVSTISPSRPVTLNLLKEEQA